MKPGGLERVRIGRETRQSIIGRQFNRLRLRLRIKAGEETPPGVWGPAGLRRARIDLMQPNFPCRNLRNRFLALPYPVQKPAAIRLPIETEQKKPAVVTRRGEAKLSSSIVWRQSRQSYAALKV